MSDDLSPEELDGGWRRLCGAMLGFAADWLVEKPLPAIASKSGLAYRMEAVAGRRNAARWVNGEPSMISFNDVCEALDLDEDYARRSVDKYLAVSREKRRPA